MYDNITLCIGARRGRLCWWRYDQFERKHQGPFSQVQSGHGLQLRWLHLRYRAKPSGGEAWFSDHFEAPPRACRNAFSRRRRRPIGNDRLSQPAGFQPEKDVSEGPPRIIAGHANQTPAFPRLVRDEHSIEPAHANKPVTPPGARRLSMRPRPEQARKLSAAQTEWDERWDGLA